jgi:putative spermidine/putrescine transport system permease protein
MRVDAAGRGFHLLFWSVALLALLLLVAPTLVVLVVSLTDGYSLKFPPPGYSTRWYHALLEAWQLHFAAWNSVKVAVATTLLSVVLGVAGALAIARSPTATARVLDSLFMSPMVLPALAFGFAALMTFSAVGWEVSATTLVIGCWRVRQAWGPRAGAPSAA